MTNREVLETEAEEFINTFNKEGTYSCAVYSDIDMARYTFIVQREASCVYVKGYLPFSLVDYMKDAHGVAEAMVKSLCDELDTLVLRQAGKDVEC